MAASVNGCSLYGVTEVTRQINKVNSVYNRVVTSTGGRGAGAVNTLEAGRSMHRFVNLYLS